MKKETKLKNKIAYWSKHQELDKFNYQDTQSAFLGFTAILIAVIIGLFTIISNAPVNPILKGVILIALYFVIFFFFFRKTLNNYKKDIKNHRRSFRIREAMLRVFYNSLKVKTDDLDEQFEKIKKKYKKNMSNKKLEELAERIMKK